MIYCGSYTVCVRHHLASFNRHVTIQIQQRCGRVTCSFDFLRVGGNPKLTHLGLLNC